MKTEMMETAMPRLNAKVRPLEASGPPQPKDLRRHERRPYSGRVSCMTRKDAHLAALDISPGGVGLLSTKPMAVGQRVALAFLQGSMVVEGIVARVRPIFSCDWQVGVSFLRNEEELFDVVRQLS